MCPKKITTSDCARLICAHMAGLTSTVLGFDKEDNVYKQL